MRDTRKTLIAAAGAAGLASWRVELPLGLEDANRTDLYDRAWRVAGQRSQGVPGVWG